MATVDVFKDAKDDNCDLIQLLLEENNPNEPNDIGLTGLQICASNGSLTSACAYLKHGASVAIFDKESHWTALHRSLYGGHLKVSLLLLKCGAQLDNDDVKDISIRDREGLTPMDLLSVNLSNGLQRSLIDMKSGAVWSFGKADFILGVPLPKASDVVPPRRIDSLAEKCIVQINASKYHSCAVTSAGEVYTWGHGRDGRLGNGNEASQPEPQVLSFFTLRRACIEQIASGENHTIAVSRDGDVYTWGSDRFGQLGHGNTLCLSNKSVIEAPRASNKDKNEDAGGKHTNRGECLLVPKRIEALRRDFVLEVAAGDGHSLCHTRDGSLYAWGSNSSGQLGLKPTELNVLPGGGQGVNIPKKVYVEALCRGRGTTTSGHAHPGRIVQLSASHNNSMLLCFGHSPALADIKTAKEVYQWGHGIFRPTRVMFKEPKTRAFSVDGKASSGFNPVGHRGLVNIAQVAAGQHHFAGLSADGLVYTWSVEGAGLGDHVGTSIGPERKVERVDQRVDGRTGLSPPQLMKGMLSENGGGWVSFIAVTSNRMCAVTRVGDVYCWDLGKEEPPPRRIPGVKRAVAASCGADHTLVLSAYALPPLPLAESPVFADKCPLTGDPVCVMPRNSRALGVAPVVENHDHQGENEDEHELEITSVVEDMSITNSKREEEKEEDEEEEEETVPSLQALCQREVAKTVTVKTVLAALSFAEQFHATLLEKYCTNLMSLNFDAVLAQTKPSELDRYVDSWGLGDFPKGKGRSGSTLGLSSASSGSGGTAPLSKLKSASVPGAHVGDKMDRRFSAGSIDLTPTKVKKELPSTTEEVHKQMRAVKKKLNAISELEEKIKADSTLQLSVEQKDKISKKNELFAEFAHLEQLLVRCQVRERAAERTPSDDHRSVSGEKVDRNASHAVRLLQPSSSATSMPSAEESKTSAPVAEKVSMSVEVAESSKSTDRNKIDTVSTPTANTTKPVKRGKVKGISLQEFNTIVESTGSGSCINKKANGTAPSDFAAWGKSFDKNKTTAPASLSATLPTSSRVWSIQTAPTPAAVATSAPQAYAINHTVTTPAVALLSSSSDSPVKTLKKAPAGTVREAEPSAPRRARALLDFLPTATAVAKGLAPATPPPTTKAGWAGFSPVLPATTKIAAPAKTTAAATAPVRFSDIQRTEESARQTSTIATLQGNSRPWFVERHQRAASIEEVVRQQALDRAEEEEIARAVAEIDRISEIAAKTKAQKNAGKSARGGQEGGGGKMKKEKKLSNSGAVAKK